MADTRIVAEIGINHVGSVEKAKELINLAFNAGADYVKFQKRTPELSVPKDQWSELRCTPFGIMEKLEYRKKVEFGLDEYVEIDRECYELGIKWFASVWDAPSVDFLNTDRWLAMVNYIKIPSALMENREVQRRAYDAGYDLIISTGMHTRDEIENHMLWLTDSLDHDRITVMHCNSQYPTPDSHVNLQAMKNWNGLIKFPFDIGFSSHSISPFVPILAIAYAQPKFVEVHITLDRAGPSSDDSSSLERKGLELLVRERNRFYQIIGDGNLRLYDGEMPARNKLKV